MDRKPLEQKLRRAADEYSRSDLWLYATSGAYYMFFSLGPLVVIVLGLLPYLPFTEAELADALLKYTPLPFQELISTLVSSVYAGSTAALSIGLVAELWSAGKFVSLILRTVGQIYDGHAHGGYFRQRLLGALCTAVLIVLVLGNLVLLFFGERFLTAVCAAVNVPVIASGGAGCAEHFLELFRRVPTVDAGLAASIFHSGEVKIHDLKNQMARASIPARI